MILKYVNTYGEWNYIDSITRIKVNNQYKNGVESKEIIPLLETIDNRQCSSEYLSSIIFHQGDKINSIITSEAVYLLNDKGQTIERLI